MRVMRRLRHTIRGSTLLPTPMLRETHNLTSEISGLTQRRSLELRGGQGEGRETLPFQAAQCHLNNCPLATGKVSHGTLSGSPSKGC